MSSTQEQLKKLAEQKKLIAAKQKELREERDKGKAERLAANKTKTDARKKSQDARANLRKLISHVAPLFKSGDTEAMNDIAEDITASAEKLAETIKEFAEAEDALNEL